MVLDAYAASGLNSPILDLLQEHSADQPGKCGFILEVSDNVDAAVVLIIALTVIQFERAGFVQRLIRQFRGPSRGKDLGRIDCLHG